EWRPAPHCAAPAEQAIVPAPCVPTVPAPCAPEQLPMPVARPAAPTVMSCPVAPAPCGAPPATPCVPEPFATPAARAMPAPPMPPVAAARVQFEGILQPQVQLDVVLLDLDNGFFARPEGTAWADLAPKCCAAKPLSISPDVASRFWETARALKAAKIWA